MLLIKRFWINCLQFTELFKIQSNLQAGFVFTALPWVNKIFVPLLKYRSLDDVLKDKKLFIVDYRILGGIKGMPNKTVIRTS